MRSATEKRGFGNCPIKETPVTDASLGGQRRRGRVTRISRTVGSFNRCPDIAHRGAGGMHLHRVTRDVYADGSGHPVAVPRNPALAVPRGDKAVLVGSVAAPLASAEAGYIIHDFRMLRRELVDSAYHLERARRKVITDWQRRQLDIAPGADRDARFYAWDWLRPGGRGRSRSLGRGSLRSGRRRDRLLF
jgi:hypothetical protein